jgi:hypothetical protein
VLSGDIPPPGTIMWKCDGGSDARLVVQVDASLLSRTKCLPAVQSAKILGNSAPSEIWAIAVTTLVSCRVASGISNQGGRDRRRSNLDRVVFEAGPF